MSSEHMQIGEVGARTELPLRMIRYYEATGLVTPSACSAGGFRLYTREDVARLKAIRRMQPLDFTLDQMRELLALTDRLDSDDGLTAYERQSLLLRVREYEQHALWQVERLRGQLTEAEEFAQTLRKRLNRDRDKGKEKGRDRERAGAGTA
ncbi:MULTISPECIES: MerR family transcriptional regulator [Streptomyces]|uniref:MerR family transcriptional regulator n=1 Tax=Streptomyces apricus TaxID=1828112 RepID=A0A5A9ZLI3_9ACTN|nr:MerR family transcriptional regulator [Streptomyces apricus]KAA0917832.1 MerR family transcriptional regulator [Streptomyces apricus]